MVQFDNLYFILVFAISNIFPNYTIPFDIKQWLSNYLNCFGWLNYVNSRSWVSPLFNHTLFEDYHNILSLFAFRVLPMPILYLIPHSIVRIPIWSLNPLFYFLYLFKRCSSSIIILYILYFIYIYNPQIIKHR